jgi:hypothetical protein
MAWRCRRGSRLRLGTRWRRRADARRADVGGVRRRQHCPLRPRVVLHEIEHVMGYWHTDGPNDVMFATAASCRQQLSAGAVSRGHRVFQAGRKDGPRQRPARRVNLAPRRAWP